MADDTDSRVLQNQKTMEEIWRQNGMQPVDTTTVGTQPDPRVEETIRTLQAIRDANGINDLPSNLPPPSKRPTTIGGYIGSGISGLVEGARENIDNLASAPFNAAANLIGLTPKGPAVPTETRQWYEAHAGDPVAEATVPVGNFGMSALEAVALRRGLTNPAVTRLGPQTVLTRAGPQMTPALPANTIPNALLRTSAGQVSQATPIAQIATVGPGYPWLQTGVRALGSAGEGALAALGEGAGALGTGLGAAAGLAGHVLSAGLNALGPFAHLVHAPKLAQLTKLGNAAPVSFGAYYGNTPQIVDQRNGGMIEQPPMAQ